MEFSQSPKLNLSELYELLKDARILCKSFGRREAAFAFRASACATCEHTASADEGHDRAGVSLAEFLECICRVAFKYYGNSTQGLTSSPLTEEDFLQLLPPNEPLDSMQATAVHQLSALISRLTHTPR